MWISSLCQVLLEIKLPAAQLAPQVNNKNMLEKEDLDFLIELGKKINAQDPRGTQSPLFIIKQKVKNYGPDGCCNEADRIDEPDRDYLCESCEKLLDNDEMLPEWCDHCDHDAFNWYNWEDAPVIEDVGVFITAEAAQDHIDANDYHYCKPFTYGIGTWRNPEMKRVLEILSKLGSNDGQPRDTYRVR